MPSKILLPFLCITTIFLSYTSYAMEERIPPLTEEIRKELCYNQWEKLKKTIEFINCAECIKQQRSLSDPEFKAALKALRETKEFTQYNRLINSAEQSGEKT